MKECDILEVSKRTLTAPTYFQGGEDPDPQPPRSTPLPNALLKSVVSTVIYL